jgi:hypothetical protein
MVTKLAKITTVIIKKIRRTKYDLIINNYMHGKSRDESSKPN